MRRTSARIALASGIVAASIIVLIQARADVAQIERGKYLVAIVGCSDCHTPGSFFGKPDMAQYLGGSDVAFEVPGVGAFAGTNITPDRETGIGSWSTEQIVTALQTGKRPDGRILAPVMPWRDYSTLSKEDATAVAEFLKSIPPVNHRTTGPFAPGEKVTSFLYRILPPGEEAATKK